MRKELINILLVDDDPGDCAFTKLSIAKSRHMPKSAVQTAGSLAECLECLKSKSSDLVLLDLGLPDSQGLATLDKVYQLCPDIPIVVLTGLADEELGVEAIRRGASDYLVKSKFFKDLLVRTIRYAIERLATQRKLQRHIRQFKCFYALSELIERPRISLERIFQETTHLICNAYEQPDLTCVRIAFDGVHYKTDNFKKTELSQHVEIKIRGHEAGGIEVYHLGERAESGEAPFLEEECNLLNTVAEHLGQIAERHQTREELQLFRDLIDRSNDSILVIEPKWGRLLDVNNKACESLGYTREELLNMAVKDFEQTIPDDSAWTERVKEIREKGSMVLEGLCKRKDGAAFPVEMNIKFVSQDKHSYLIAVVRDIAERKRAEDALRKSENKYRTLLENIPQRVFLKDKDSVYVSCNENFAGDLKIRPDKIGGKTDHDLFPKGLAEKYQAGDQQVIESGETLEVDEPYIQSGRESIVHTVKTPVKDEQGNVAGVLGIFWDITELKLAQESQAELLVELESANRELKDFAHIVSHDLKAPLFGIKTVAEWLSTDCVDKLDEENKEHLDLLMGRTDRMYDLIDGILAYSRAGRAKQELVQTDLSELVGDIVDSLAVPKHIRIAVEEKLPVIECEQTRITQVFQNLLSNAVKYMDKPKGRIRVGCAEEDGFWRFSVADNGPGIEQEHFERIFQIFQTGAPRDEVDSTGVGLTVVKKIVEMDGGKIWVESEVGQGSTFFFTLPKQEKEIEHEKSEANIAC